MDYEEEKIKIENSKLEIELEKLKLEYFKSKLETRKTLWTSVSVGVPVIVALLTVGYGFWSARETAKIQFQVEAAKAAMLSQSRAEGKERIEFYKQLFPDQMKDIKPATGIPDDDNSKKEFVAAIASSKDLTARQVFDMWQVLYPNEDWYAGMEAVIKSAANSKASAKP